MLEAASHSYSAEGVGSGAGTGFGGYCVDLFSRVTVNLQKIKLTGLGFGLGRELLIEPGFSSSRLSCLSDSDVFCELDISAGQTRAGQAHRMWNARTGGMVELGTWAVWVSVRLTGRASRQPSAGTIA